MSKKTFAEQEIAILQQKSMSKMLGQKELHIQIR